MNKIKCNNLECGYISLENDFLAFGGCPACGADFNGVVDPNAIPKVFYQPEKKNEAKKNN